ncbi:MAG: DUF4335 domain-containing protein [Pleurocapsa sp.]
MTTIRRFTPPTCTLEIKANNSPLSRWTNRGVFNNLRFQLSFDDPKIPKEEQIAISGDRTQLEQLYDAVIDYVQYFLHQSFTINLSKEKLTPSDRPYLETQELVNHLLCLGSLANGDATNIQLSSVQLFDLVTALEEYHTQVVALPDLNPAKSRHLLPIWGGIAATTILAIALTTAGIQLSRQKTSDSVISTAKPESQETIPQLDDLVSPQVPKSNRIELKPQPQQPLSSTEKLPPPPAVDVLKPQPDIPDPAKYPLPEIAARAGIKAPQQQVESTVKISPTTQENKSESNSVAIAPLQTPIERSHFTIPDRVEPLETNTDTVLNSPINSDPLSEVSKYFVENWQPPAELKQSLEYRLFVDASGKIHKVTPIGKASELYLQYTNIPLRGETFISPLEDRNQITVRLLLNPDGEVTAFLE